MTLHQTGTFQTPQASKYLQQLCRHFAHKVAVEYDASQGRAALPPGPAPSTRTSNRVIPGLPGGPGS